MKPILLLTFILLIALPSVAQRHFFFEQPKPFKHPIKLPTGVLRVLRQEIERAHRCQLDQSTNISRWFVASRIDLGAGRQAFIARSYEDCLNGADNDWFWIILKTLRGYRLVLFEGTISVDVLKSKSHGLHDIETNVATARTNYIKSYRFNGSVYKAHICTEATPVDAKPERVPCRE